MKNLYCLFLDRDNMREGLKTILQAIDYVKMAFPSAFSRKEPATMAKSFLCFHSVTVHLKLPKRTGCAIIPISMNNTADIFEAHFPRVKKYISSSNTANQSIQKNWIKRHRSISVLTVRISSKRPFKKMQPCYHRLRFSVLSDLMAHIINFLFTLSYASDIIK